MTKDVQQIEAHALNEDFFLSFQTDIQSGRLSPSLPILINVESLDKCCASFLTYAKDKRLNIQITNADRAMAQALEGLNARFHLAYQAGLQSFNTLDVEADNHSYTVAVKSHALLAFEADNEVFGELQQFLSRLKPGAWVHVYLPTAVNAQVLIDWVISAQLICNIVLFEDNKNSDKLTSLNAQLASFYRYQVRHHKPLSDEQTQSLCEQPLSSNKKIRRTKQALNRGQRIQAAVQHQMHHQQEHAVAQESSVDQEQQTTQEQFQSREQQIAEQQQRMLQNQQANPAFNLGALGKLIHRDNLHQLVTADYSLETLEEIWFNLVGRCAHLVADPRNRITHVPEDTFWLIVNHRHEFSDGIHFDNLPNGFGFEVIEKDEQTQSIFYHQASLEQAQIERTDTVLAAQLITYPKPVLEGLGDVGQFYPFFASIGSYASFCKQYQRVFDTIYHSNARLKKRKHAFIQLLQLDDPNFKDDSEAPLLDDLTSDNLSALSQSLLHMGSQKIVAFLIKLNQLKASNQYALIKTAFLDGLDNWHGLIDYEPSHPQGFDTWQAIDYLHHMPANERVWWETLLTQHLHANKHLCLADLASAHHYFFTEINALNVTLPTPCPLDNITHMKTAYDRLLFILRKSINPHEQAHYLQHLDLGMQGAICGASRLGQYVLVTEDMKLTPKSAEFDWEKYRHYLLPDTEYYYTWSEDDLTSPIYLTKKKPEQFRRQVLWIRPNKLFFTQDELYRRYLKYAEDEKISDHDRCPPGFYTDIYRFKYDFISETVASLVRHKHTHAMVLMDKHQDCLRLVRVHSRSGEFRGDKLYANSLGEIKDPQAMDDILATKSSYLAYDIDIKTLAKLANQFNSFFSAEKYFYRYIGCQRYTHVFLSYQQLLLTLQTNGLGNDDESDNRLKKQLLPLMAFSTTGPRALKRGKQLTTDVDKFINWLQIHAQPLLGAQVLEQMNGHLDEQLVKPTLPEAMALLQLSLLADMNTLMQSITVHGEVMYAVMVNVSEHQNATFTRKALNTLLTKLVRLRLGNAEQHAWVCLLASLLPAAEWPHFFQQPSTFLTLKNPVILSEALSFLRLVNVAKTKTLLSVTQITHLIEALHQLDQKGRVTSLRVQKTLREHFANLYVADVALSQSLTQLIEELGVFAEELEALLDEVRALNLGVKGGIFIELIAGKLQSIIDKLKTANQTGNPADIKAVLTAIQEVIGYLNYPGLGFIREQLLTPLITMITHTMTVDISQKIDDLHIDDRVLVLDTVILSSALNDYLVARLPVIKGKKLAIEIDACFQEKERMDAFLTSLSDWPSPKRRDRVLAELYRQGAFHKDAGTDLDAWIEILTLLRASHRDSPRIVRWVMQSQLTIRQKITLLDALLDDTLQLNEADSFALLDLAQDEATWHNALSLIHIKRHWLTDHSSLAREAFSTLLHHVKTLTQESKVLARLVEYLRRYPNRPLMQFIKWIGKHESQPLPVLGALLDSLSHVEKNQVGAILTILAGACWRRLDEAVSLDDQQTLITKLAHLTPETLHKLDALYQLTPCPGIQALLEQSTKSDDEIAAWIAAYELDPFGHRHMMIEQYTLKGVNEFLAGMQPLTEEQILPDALKDTLKENIQYILACSHHACLPISGTIKPINQFTAQELQSYYQDCMAKSHSNFEDSTPRLEALAVLCEVYFRTTGRFPYYSQILSVMSTFYLNGHTLLEIPTGQGKSITKALLAAWQFSFGRVAGASHVMALAPNALLTKRDFDESRAFFDYLHLPTALVTATTVDNHFETPTIIYSTAADASLYCSKLKMVDKAHFPLADARFLIVDEVDAELYDNSTAFNFSDSQEDIYTNPLAWVYPLANQFIDSPIFLNEAFTEQEDVLLFKQYLQKEDTNAYQQHETRLSAFKLNQLLDAACIAKQLQENRDFLVRRVTRMVYGKEQIISQAHVLINHVEDKEATLSYGVQQALHARLNQQHEENIDLFKRTNGEQGMPPFPCDNQIECIDSQNVASFFSQFGYQVGITGTAGTAQELTSAMTHFGFQHLLKIPPRRPGKLHYLPTVFCNPNVAFFFRASTQIEALQRLAMKHKHQPLLIACKDIDKTEQLYGGLVQSVGSDRIQMIHAKNCDDTEEFERRIAQAKQAGMITLVTPLVGRGVDIKTQRANVNPPKSKQQHLDKLAETLLVVETDLFRYRDRAQLKGRTARDGKAGEFIGIFNLNDLVAQANRDTRPRSRHAKLALLDLITATMDAEATVEHGIRHQVKKMQISWANQFDAYLQQALDTEQQRAIVAAKAQFLLESDRLWTQLLEDANPNGQRLNPYICYTNHTLDSEHLNATLVQYRTQLTPLYQALIEPLNLDPLLLHPAIPVVAQPERLALIDAPKNQTMIPTFIARQEQKPVENETQALYRAALAANETVQKELAPWLAKYPQTQPLFLQAQHVRNEAINKKRHSAMAANLMGLGVCMAQGNLAHLTVLMDSHALALQTLTAIAAPPDVLPALLKTLNAAVLSPAIPGADKEAFVRLHGELQTHNNSSLTAVLIELPVLLDKAFYQTSHVESRHYLKSMKLYVNSLGMCLSNEDNSTPPHPLTAEADLIVTMLSDFIDKTCTRLGQSSKPFTQSKIDTLKAYKEQLRALDWKALLEEKNDYSLNHFLAQLNDIQIDNKPLASLLQLNTRSGKLDNATTAYKEYGHLQRMLNKRFKLDRTLQQINQQPDNCLTALDDILTNLRKRQAQAGLLKDKALYQRKVDNLQGYIEEVQSKLKIPTAQTDSVMRALMCKIKNDADITNSTSRFFKLKSRVTVINDLERLNNTLNHA